ncbi:hypothetical protein Tco_1058439 [Tanacetum coccineum]|uniref:Uncharacterized protein n=1 Tax=Tanacetum coccineum TaxID=301880 RepID=A0ABQ5HA34_9ASTR
MTELILRECMEKAQDKSSPAKPKIDNNVKIELSKEHLKELRNNTYGGTKDEDVVDHIANVLEIRNLIKTPDMDTDRLRVFSYKYYPISRAGKYVVTWDDGDEGDDYMEFIIWLNSKCKDHNSMYRTTKSALWHYWLNEEGNNELMDDAELSEKELKESDYGNPRNTDDDSFFKPYLDAKEKDNKDEI